MRKILFLIPLMAFIINTGCKKMLDVPLPIDKVSAEDVFRNSGTATAALTSIYANSRTTNIFVGPTGVTIGSGMLSDEIEYIDGTGLFFYRNEIPGWEKFIWDICYRRFIYQANAIIEGVSKSTTISQVSKDILIGEAKFMRAYLYFYLVNFYGDIPLVLNTDIKLNTRISRTPKSEIYAFIINDLKDAQTLLSDDYLATDISSVTQERIRPNRGAATALLSRVYLYSKKWQNAEEEATKIINNDRYQLEENLDNVFLKNSKEAIWQLQPVSGVDGSTNTPDGMEFIPYPGDRPKYCIGPHLIEAFEEGDLRLLHWTRQVSSVSTNYRIPYKYKIGRTLGEFQDQTEYIMVLRLAEQYLIRAEARAMQGRVIGINSAELDLNTIRNRAGLPNSVAESQVDMLNLLANERKVELFTEGGQRWFDISRTGKIDSIMSVVCQTKGTNWMPFKALFPIPFDEFKTNPALRGHQNPGYSEQ